MSQKNPNGKLPFPSLTTNLRPILMLTAAAILLFALLLILVPSSTQDDALLAPDQPVSQDATKAGSDCAITQTIRYDRCGHEITRRQIAPMEVAGKTMSEVEPLYADWTITEFAANEIKMNRSLALYCPDHVVLMPDGTGMLCVFQNTYGDALGLVRELGTPFDSLSSAMQEEVRPGLGFSSLSELESWLESAES